MTQIADSESWIEWLTILMPAIAVGTLKMRFRLSIFAASAILYPITIAWGFANGVTYSMNWNRTPHDFFERNTLGVEQPIHFGLVCAQIWIAFGILYTAAFAGFAWLTAVVVARGLENHRT
ncbi:hypothetical protein [Allorhodopirellula heiligendammensis]|nr:hypothetical protein [Allorhodopirellula heiligendammensis]